MKLLLALILSGAFFHAWLFIWYFPKHCLSDRKVGWPERYRAFWNWLKR